VVEVLVNGHPAFPDAWLTSDLLPIQRHDTCDSASIAGDRDFFSCFSACDELREMRFCFIHVNDRCHEARILWLARSGQTNVPTVASRTDLVSPSGTCSPIAGSIARTSIPLIRWRKFPHIWQSSTLSDVRHSAY